MERKNYFYFSELSLYGCCQILALCRLAEFFDDAEDAECFRSDLRGLFWILINIFKINDGSELPEDVSETTDQFQIFFEDYYCLERLSNLKLPEGMCDRDKFDYRYYSRSLKRSFDKLFCLMLKRAQGKEVKEIRGLMDLVSKYPYLAIRKDNFRAFLNILLPRHDLSAEALVNVFMNEQILHCIYNKYGGKAAVDIIVSNNIANMRKEGPQARVRELMEEYGSWGSYQKFKL